MDNACTNGRYRGISCLSTKKLVIREVSAGRSARLITSSRPPVPLLNTLATAVLRQIATFVCFESFIFDTYWLISPMNSFYGSLPREARTHANVMVNLHGNEFVGFWGFHFTRQVQNEKSWEDKDWSREHREKERGDQAAHSILAYQSSICAWFNHKM